MASNYARGREFEYRVRNKLLKDGAVYVMRAASSKGAADLIALWPLTVVTGENGYRLRRTTWLVQCKLHGKLPRAEREELVRIAREAGATPMHAQTGPKGRGVVFTNLLEDERNQVG